ncbi:hypothetical protein LIER_32324 [Lithospermum erythrorhizon]|uniref:Uncharacterized protein n=1 Tax=Lithospermum erythrorhizon TaxID=34254 RepID=A0AAV3RZF8_LITER
MLELIRSKVMERIKDRWNGRDGFEVKAGHEQYIVNIRETGHNVRRCPRKQQGEEVVKVGSSSKKTTKKKEIMANDVDATIAAEPKTKESKTKQPKRRQPKKKESTVDATVAAANVDPRPATIAVCEDDPIPTLDQKMLVAISRRREVAIKRRQDLLKAREESSSKALAFIPLRPAIVVENEDDDIQIIKVVKDPYVDHIIVRI